MARRVHCDDRCNERGRTGQRPTLAGQDLEVVVEHEHLPALRGRAFVPRYLDPTVEHDQCGGTEVDADPVPDEPGRHRILALPHGDPRVAIDPRREGERRERLGRQRPQQVALEREVRADGVDSVGDAPVVVLRVGGVEQFVEFGDRVDDRHRDAVGAAEPAAFAFDAGLAVERVEAVVRSERCSKACM